jgi:hypothetical protein
LPIILANGILPQVPDLVQKLSNFYEILDNRLAVFPKLLSFYGRLDLASQQISMRKAFTKAVNAETVTGVYIEDDEEEDSPIMVEDKKVDGGEDEVNEESVEESDEESGEESNEDPDEKSDVESMQSDESAESDEESDREPLQYDESLKLDEESSESLQYDESESDDAESMQYDESSDDKV